MAERFTALSELKTAFGKFGEMSDLLDRMRGKVGEINKFNKDSAGQDDIGKQYHQTVDRPTKDLTDLLTQVRESVDKVGENGKDATDQFTNTDQNLKDTTSGF
ncbi:hypothetical protein [Kitasatospora azatica]|uniref:hypothetical protein n=1 Tax=Kitasatospora azatica TaxID=58347 RepID=UPI000562E8D1|nr:hypothetical protein [Kitasatospora azatica]